MGPAAAGTPPAAPPVEPTPEPEPDAAAMEPPPSGSGGEGASSDADAAPPEEGDGELFPSAPDGLQQEFLIRSPCAVTIERKPGRPLPLSRKNLNEITEKPGIYVILIHGKPWYVGAAERSVRKRLQERMKALRDFDIPESALDNRTVSWFVLKSAPGRGCPIGRGPKDTGPYLPLKEINAVLKVLEKHFIKELGTSVRGNVQWEGVKFEAGGLLRIKEPGKAAITRSGKDLLLPR
jgi:hypothetical protein